MRNPKKRSLLDVNEHFEGKRKVAFKRGQRELALFAERSNQKELNAKITLLDNFLFCAQKFTFHNTIYTIFYYICSQTNNLKLLIL